MADNKHASWSMFLLEAFTFLFAKKILGLLILYQACLPKNVAVLSMLLYW